MAQQRIKQRQIFETPADAIVRELDKSGELSFAEVAKRTGVSVEAVEKISAVLEKKGLVSMHYSALVIKQPSVTMQKKLVQKSEAEIEGKEIEEYSYFVDSVPVNVKVIAVENEQRPVYSLEAPFVSEYTDAFLDVLKEAILEKLPIDLADLSDVKKNKGMKERFFEVARKELQVYFKMAEESLNTLAGLMLHSMYGLGRLELILGDNYLEEMTINSSRSPVVVYHRKYGWLKTNISVVSDDEIYNYSSQIARKVGREITTLSPILDAHLVSGDRVNATLSPISTFGNTLTIRRFARKPWTIVDFIGESHTMNLEIASVLWLAMQYEMNVLIAGGTASGKTSALNVLSAFIPSYHRIISIEDVREIMLPDYLHTNWVPLTTRNPNQEGQGEVSMLELMQSSLRMRPDRIILGEIRRKNEAEVLFEAMHTGHSVYSTIHANSADQVLKRLIEPPISVPPLEVEAVDLVLVQYRDRRLNTRRTYELAEIESGIDEKQLTVNTVFKWQPREDVWESINPASKLVRNLNLHTGMTEKEIKTELEGRATILQWMLDNKVNDIDQVGAVMKFFYTNQEAMKQAAEKNAQPKKILEM